MRTGATIGVMSEPDAVPLPRGGEVFFDVRGEARSMRLSWYADSAVAVFSIWQGNRCTATFRLPFGDLARMVEVLQSGPAGHAAEASSRHSAERSFESSRSDPGYGHPEQSAYGPAAAYGEEPWYESRRGYETEPGYVTGYQTGPGYEPGPHYGAEPNYHPPAPYGSGHDYGYRSEQNFGGEPAYRDYSRGQGDAAQQARDDDYDNPHPAGRPSTGPSHGPPGYREARHSVHDLNASQPYAAPYRGAHAYLTGDSDPLAPANRSDADRPATAHAHYDRGAEGMPAYAPAYPGETSQVRFPSAPVTTEHAEPDWDTATAAYRDR
jgi:hypothetical protein